MVHLDPCSRHCTCLHMLAQIVIKLLELAFPSWTSTRFGDLLSWPCMVPDLVIGHAWTSGLLARSLRLDVRPLRCGIVILCQGVEGRAGISDPILDGVSNQHPIHCASTFVVWRQGPGPRGLHRAKRGRTQSQLAPDDPRSGVQSGVARS